MCKQKQSRKGRKHSSLEQIALTAKTLGAGFTVADITVKGNMPRCVLKRAMDNGIIVPQTKGESLVTVTPLDVKGTTKGRPAHTFKLTPEGRKLAEKEQRKLAREAKAEAEVAAA